MNKKQIYYLISSILSLRVKPERAPGIIGILPQKEVDWQKWVYWGSRHLVLQSMFLNLKKNQLLSCLPEELSEYLKHIHQLNVERNQSIKNQARNIFEICNKEGIGSVFMKGTANIFDGLYYDIGERMVYDIDILVEEDKMLKAADALLAIGYRTQKNFNPLAYPSTMHYPILLREDCVAGVEIHRLPVQYHYLKFFGSKQVFATKKRAALESDFWVMCNSNKLIHNFIHSQLMHNGHYHADVSLRDLYDLLLLSQREDINKVFADFKYFRSKSKTYVSLMHKAFDLPTIDSVRKTQGNNFFFTRHNLTLTLSRRHMLVYHFLISALIKYVALPLRTIFDQNARNYVFSRLKNRHWYKEHINAYRRKFSKKRGVN